jgi:hypothetical protein
MIYISSLRPQKTATWEVLGPNYMYGMGRMRILNILPDSDCALLASYRPWSSDQNCSR